MPNLTSMAAPTRTYVRTGLVGLLLLCLLVLPSTAEAVSNPVSGVWVVPGNAQNTISWERATAAVPGTNSYRVYRSTTSGTLGAVVGTVTDPATTYVDTAVANGTSYYYTVRTWDGAVESTDPVQQITSTGKSMPTGRWWDDCSGTLNGKMYVFGGYAQSSGSQGKIYSYDPVTNTVATEAPTMPNSRYWCGADRANGSLYLFGGGSGSNGATEYAQVYKFNPTTGLTLANGTLPTAYAQVSAQTMADGTIAVVGGQNGTTLSNSVYRFNPFTDPVGALPVAKTLTYPNGVGTPGTTAIDGKVFMIGGNFSGSGNMQPNLRAKRIDIVTGTQTYTELNLTNPSTPRLGNGVVALNDRVYSLSGGTASSEGTACGFLSCNVTNAITVWDDRLGGWTSLATTLAGIGGGRLRMTAMRMKGFIYFTGGNDGTTLNDGTLFPQIYKLDPGGQVRGTPGAPVATTASALSATPTNHTVTVSWTAGANVDYYRIFRSTSAGVRGALIEEQMGEQDAPGTSIADGGLVNGSTYYYTVSAVGYDGHETTAPAQVNATPQGPKDPTVLTQFESNGTTAIVGGAITVSGQATNVVLKFNVSHTQNAKTIVPWVEVSTTGVFAETCGVANPGVTFSGANVVAAVANTLYPATVNVTGLTDGTTYYWQACAMAGPDDSYWVARGGAPDFVTDALPDAQPVTPAAGAWTNDSTPALTARHVDANADTGQVQFEVCTTNATDPWSANCGSSYQTFTSAAGIANNATTAWSPATALPSGTNYWRIRSTDSRGLAGPWTAQAIRIDLVPPTVPTNLVIHSGGSSDVNLSWTASTDALSAVTYDVSYSLNGSTWTVACTATAATNCTAAGIASSTGVVMRVRACDAATNCTGWSSRAGATGGTYFLRSGVNSTQLTNAQNKQAATTSGTDTATTTTVNYGAGTGWFPVRPNVAASTTNAGAVEPATTAPYTNPTGTGWVIDAAVAKRIAAGDITVDFTFNDNAAAAVGDLQCRAYRVTQAAGSITGSTFLGKSVAGPDVLTGGANATGTCLAANLATQVALAANESIYIELWLHVTGAGVAASTFSLHTEGALTNVTIPALGTNIPNVPGMVAPANGVTTTVTPTLQASYTHPTPVGGFTEFEVATSGAFGATTIQSGTSALLATGNTGSLVLDPLVDSTVYSWRVRGVDSFGFVSAWSVTRTFTASDPTAITVSLSTNAINLGTVLPNNDAFGSFTATVTTSNPTGYQLTALGAATGTLGATCAACANPTADWTGTDATPTVWAASSGGYTGLTVRSATGGRLAKWGTGTGTAEPDVVNNKYAGLGSVSAMQLHNRTTAAAGDPVIVTWRFDPAAVTSAVVHTETITITALVNP
ncbi:MAG: Kelch repeat-containing protein [Thermoleophilia bacterium]|nr:Kelch repeat-containing protein [Thermoleophilia bacterium]